MRRRESQEPAPSIPSSARPWCLRGTEPGPAGCTQDGATSTVWSPSGAARKRGTPRPHCPCPLRSDNRGQACGHSQAWPLEIPKIPSAPPPPPDLALSAPRLSAYRGFGRSLSSARPSAEGQTARPGMELTVCLWDSRTSISFPRPVFLSALASASLVVPRKASRFVSDSTMLIQDTGRGAT